FTPQGLRNIIYNLFPELSKKDSFDILFLTDLEKKNTIAIQFLTSFLSDVIDQFGHAGDGYFERKQDDLTQLNFQKEKDETFAELQSLSFEIFQFVHENYGEAFARNLFERTYDRFSSKYKELKIFPQLITLIPKEIVRRKHLGIFTQAQIEQIYLD